MVRTAIVVGKCQQVLSEYAENTFTAVVTDPPYGLNPKLDIHDLLRNWLDNGTYDAKGGGFMSAKWDSVVPGPALWREVYRVLKPGGHAMVFCGARTMDLMGLSLRLAGFEVFDLVAWLNGQGQPKGANIGKHLNAPADSPWHGWRTQLAPRWEGVFVARKPMQGTFATNAEKHGVAGLAIEKSRIEREVINRTYSGGFGGQDPAVYGGTVKHDLVQWENTAGGYPGNVALDEVVAADLDELNGAGSGGRGPSRYFYCSKASLKEREFGLGAMTGERANRHPTVKPIALMRWLVGLASSPEGTYILDPFAGSGTTGVACALEGLDFLGIEQNEDFALLARKRIEVWKELA